MTGASEDRETVSDDAARGAAVAARVALRDMAVAWDLLRLCAHSRRGQVIADLRAARQAALRIGDASLLPVADEIWRSAINLVGLWLKSSDDHRADARVEAAVTGAIDLLKAGLADTIGEKRNTSPARAPHETEDDHA